MSIFQTTLSQMAFLFLLIIVGYVLAKTKQVPENAAATLSKLENTLFIPCLVAGTFIENFTLERIAGAWKLLLVSTVICLIAIPLAIGISRLCAKDKYTQNIYTYGLVFSNFGFMGNAVVSAVFPDLFFEYIIFTLPLWAAIYLWAVPVLLISDAGQKQTLLQRAKSFLNPMFIAMLIGMVIGLTGLKLPGWMSSAISTLGSCMSPVAMLLTGITVSFINIRETFTNVKIYIVTAIRLLVFPLIFIAVMQFVPMSETVRVCALCSLAMPLGLNTIVVPSAYGKDTSVAAGMAIISHLLSCLTIPLMFMFL
ncbi:MAG: AEC family transporter [Clostridia bacterium]|nr:AEC family transporter [Clostridia bacterium]